MSKKRILIIDDDLVFVKILKNRLEVAGYDVLSALDGIKGVQMARKERPDLIIMDVMMPGMDGHRACELIKKSPLTWNIPVIYVTIKDSLGDEELAMELGAEYYIKKPYQPEVLLRMIESALERAEQLSKREEKILVIDRDLAKIDEIKIVLEQAGFKIISSLNARDGMNKARTEKPDLILLDDSTSSMDQHSSYDELKSGGDLKNIPVFVFTTKTRLNGMIEKLNHVTRFILEPIDYKDLLRNIEEILKK